MAKVLILNHGRTEDNNAEVLAESLTDEQARELANKYNDEHFKTSYRYAKVVLCE